jgi:hypothetical protein
MLRISLREMLIIGIITIMCGFIIHKIIYKYGSDEIKQTNIFYINRKNWLFYISLFLIGISIHAFIKYAEVQEWYCEKKCIDGVCEVLCHLPINGFTELIITK